MLESGKAAREASELHFAQKNQPPARGLGKELRPETHLARMWVSCRPPGGAESPLWIHVGPGSLSLEDKGRGIIPTHTLVYWLQLFRACSKKGVALFY